MGMSWIISTNKEMEYEINKTNHQDWLNKGHWYNISICLNFHGSMFEYFITHARTDRYNLMCSLVAHDKMQPNDEDCSFRSPGRMPCPNYEAVEFQPRIVDNSAP